MSVTMATAKFIPVIPRSEATRESVPFQTDCRAGLQTGSQ